MIAVPPASGAVEATEAGVALLVAWITPPPASAGDVIEVPSPRGPTDGHA
jgi:hypothetical protein